MQNHHQSVFCFPQPVLYMDSHVEAHHAYQMHGVVISERAWIRDLHVIWNLNIFFVGLIGIPVIVKVYLRISTVKLLYKRCFEWDSRLSWQSTTDYHKFDQLASQIAWTLKYSTAHELILAVANINSWYEVLAPDFCSQSLQMPFGQEIAI